MRECVGEDRACRAERGDELRLPVWMRLPLWKRGSRRSKIRDRAARGRENGNARRLSLRLAIIVGIAVGLLPAIALLLVSLGSQPALLPVDPVRVAAARTVAAPTPPRAATPRPTPTPWPLDLWTRMITVPTPAGDWAEVDVEIPVETPGGAIVPSAPTAVAPSGGIATPTPTPEPDIISPEEITRIQAAAQAAVAAEAAIATPVTATVGTGHLGAAVPDSIRRWESLILAATDRYKVDPNLIAALMMTESEGNPNALSSAGAVGLMQIMGGPWDPAENIRLGTAIMADNLRRYGGRVDLALAGYNAGNGAVAKYGGIPPYRETRDQLFRVLLRYELYSTQ